MRADNQETVKFKGCFICQRTDHFTSDCPRRIDARVNLLGELEAADDILKYSLTDDEAEVNEVMHLIARGQRLAEEAKRKGNDIAPPSGK